MDHVKYFISKFNLRIIIKIYHTFIGHNKTFLLFFLGLLFEPIIPFLYKLSINFVASSIINPKI